MATLLSVQQSASVMQAPPLVVAGSLQLQTRFWLSHAFDPQSPFWTQVAPTATPAHLFALQEPLQQSLSCTQFVLASLQQRLFSQAPLVHCEESVQDAETVPPQTPV